MYEGGFGALYDHFGVIVESLWVYEGQFFDDSGVKRQRAA